MNDDTHARYTAYLRTLGDALLLRDWEIELRRDWAEDDAYASASTWHKENHLWVRINEGFSGHPPYEQREWLVHELLHAHLGRADQAVMHLVDVLPENEAVKVFKRQMEDETEIVVQRLARILAPFLPLPQETTDVPE